MLITHLFFQYDQKFNQNVIQEVETMLNFRITFKNRGKIRAYVMKKLLYVLFACA